MAIVMSNNAASTLASGISSGATSFTVASGSTFPSLSSGDFTFVTIGTEVIKVTARSGANFTCDQTSASHSSGDTVELRVTSELLNAFSTDAESLAKAGGEMSGNITMAGSQTVDGRDLSADGSKLDGIDTGAKNDQTAAEIKTLLEDGIDSVHYVNGSIDTEHIADDQVTAALLANSINTDIATGVTANTTANAALPKAGGTMTGNLVMGTNLVDGIDISARDAVLTSTTTTAGAALPKAGGTMTGALAITTADNTDTLTVISTDADAASAPNLDFYRNSASPANGDGTGKITFRGRNNNSQDVDYATIDTWSTDVSDGTEDGEFILRTIKNGTSNNVFAVNSTEIKLNESGVDLDFRVESDGKTHAFFVDGGTGTVTVGANAVGTMTTDNDGSFAMSASNNFKCTPSGNFTLTFTAIVAQSGNILLINSGGHTVAAHSNTKVDATLLATVSTAGTYLLAYFSDGTNVYMTNSAAYA